MVDIVIVAQSRGLLTANAGGEIEPMEHREQSRRRVALYSHDTQGLGHVRRNIAIATALVQDRPDTDVLLLTSAPEAAMLGLPPHTDVVTLPTLHKDSGGTYQPEHLHLPLAEVLQLRGQLVAAALGQFDPDLFLVDKVARGVGGELDAALRVASRSHTRVVLGVRDVLDSPEIAAREWQEQHTADALHEHFDQIWVYGDPAVYDPARAYGWPEWVRDRTHYTGYLAKDRLAGPGTTDGHTCRPHATEPPRDRPYVLCLLGGGQDGAALGTAFAGARFPAGHQGVLVTGPYMPAPERERIDELARTRTDLTVHRLTNSTAELIDSASATVAMGGYNTVCELLSVDQPRLIVPRVAPRMEQAIRAEALAALGWLDTLGPDKLTPERLGDWLHATVSAPPRPRRPIDMDGLTRIPQFADTLLGDRLPEASYAAV